MTNYKAIVTLTWKFNSDKPHLECLQAARDQLDQILNSKPQGDDFDGFSVQVDIAPMKERKYLIHMKEFDPEEILSCITEDECKREYDVDGQTYSVRMNSDRYHVFKANRKCVACGLEGTKMILDMNPGDATPHFNLYAEENGRLVLMTKDHILAKSKGGTDSLENYTTCCSVCNNLKANYDLTYEQVKELRILHNNEQKLPKKELRSLINKTRDKMSKNV